MRRFRESTSSNCSTFSEMCQCCLQHWDPEVSLWRATDCLSNSLVCLGSPTGPLWSTNKLDVPQSQYWKIHLVTRDGQLELSPPLFQDLSFYCYPVSNKLINLREKIGIMQLHQGTQLKKMLLTSFSLK